MSRSRGPYWDEREMYAINACALRFDGYKYFEELQSFKNSVVEVEGVAAFHSSELPIFDDFLNDPDYTLEINFLHAVFYMFQRAWLRECSLPPNSYGAKIARELFLALCHKRIPEGYRVTWNDWWEKDCADRVSELETLVRKNLEQTKYTSKKKWQETRD